MGKYISHLDLLRCFTRAIQRSGLHVVYSQGFNPHQKMTFSLPLPIGVTSQCETVDISFEDSVTDAEIMEKLNENLPMDIKVLSVGDMVFKAADIKEAEYVMKAFVNNYVVEKSIKNFFGQDEVIVMKKTKKKGEKPVNILEYVKSWEICDNCSESFELKLVVDAGGERNLKPEIIGKALAEYLGENSISDWDIHRTKIYCVNSNNLLEVFC